VRLIALSRIHDLRCGAPHPLVRHDPIIEYSALLLVVGCGVSNHCQLTLAADEKRKPAFPWECVYADAAIA
jgi:hypothetical protein